jgi:hypothetical protein
MSEISLKLLEKLLDLEFNINKIEEFKNEYKEIKESINSNYNLLIQPNKISKLNKNRENILSFISKYENMITVFHEKDMLWEMTGGFDLNYHWEDIYKNILIEIKKIKKENVLKLISFLKENGFNNIYYDNNLNKKYYEKFNKKYNSEKYEIDYYISDGQKIYLAQYQADSFPIIFENAKIILEYRKNNWFSNGKTAYLSSFDIDLDKIKYIEDENEILINIPFEEIKKLTTICRQINSFDKQISSIEDIIEITKKLLDYKDLKELSSKQIKDLDILLKSTKEQREALLKTYIDLGYNKETISSSLKHFKNAEWNVSLHCD